MNKFKWESSDIINLSEPILLFQWQYAPEELRAYSNMGGDEDWIVCIPKKQFNHDHGYLRFKFDDEHCPFFGFKQSDESLVEYNGKQYYILIYGH